MCSEIYIGVRVKCSLFLADFNETKIFSIEFRKILDIKFHENSLVGGELLRADRQT